MIKLHIFNKPPTDTAAVAAVISHTLEVRILAVAAAVAAAADSSRA